MSSETLMEKPTNGKCRCRKQSWYIVLISFLLWSTLYMFYLYSSSVTFNKRGYSFIANNNRTTPLELDSSDSFHVRDVVRDDNEHVKEDINNVVEDEDEDKDEDETEKETETEEKQPIKLTEDEEVIQVIHSMLSEDQNETEPVETETNTDPTEPLETETNADPTEPLETETNADPTEPNEGSAIRENNSEDQLKRKEDQAPKQKRTTNAEDQEKMKEDQAAQQKDTVDDSRRQRTENLDDQEKRNDDLANVSKQERVVNVEGQESVTQDQAAKQKGTANVEDQEKRKENPTVQRKGAADVSWRQRAENLDDQEKQHDDLANVSRPERVMNVEVQESVKQDQAAKQKGATNVEDEEKKKEDPTVQRKGTTIVLKRQRAENLDDQEKEHDDLANVSTQQRAANVEGQESVKQDQAAKQKGTTNVADQEKRKEDPAVQRKGTANVSRERAENLDDQEKQNDDLANVSRRESVTNVEGHESVKQDQAAKQKGTANIEDEEKSKEDPAVQRKGSANVSRRQRAENLDDQEKQNDDLANVLRRESATNVEGQESVKQDQVAKQKGTANIEDEEKRKEDPAVQRKGTANVSRKQRAENLDDQEKRNDDREVPRKGVVNVEGQERTKEDEAGNQKGTANVKDQEKKKEDHTVQREGTMNASRREHAENLDDQEKQNDHHAIPRKGVVIVSRRERAENVEGQESVKENQVAKQKSTTNVEDQEKKEDRAVQRKEAVNTSRRQRTENLDDQEKRKDDRAVPRKGRENVEGQESVKEDRATKRRDTANVSTSRRRREKIAKGQGRVKKDHAANRKKNANVAERRKKGNAKALPIETLPIVKSQNKTNKPSRTQGSHKPKKRIKTAVTDPSRESMVRAGTDPCSGSYIYIHNLPKKFNQDLLENCRSLSSWTDMCECASNLGLGAPLPSDGKHYSMTGWFNTNQFLLEVIFHNRMKQYKCLTKDPSVASAIYVPYYAGLDVGRYLWDPDGFMRDYDAVNLVKWLASRPEWGRMWGRDHFLVAGRINWDFRRDPRNVSDWGNELLNFDESRNMTMLVLESSPWNYNDFAIPYPTYFHPSRDHDVIQWQNKMRKLKRRVLFSFAGARRPDRHESIRNELIDQCLASKRRCRFLECDKTQKCYKPANLMKLFQSSTFCLQPPGDSYTRRSIFDSIIAGCIPVFFHPGSAYVQYIWHFPKDYNNYSVLIHERDIKSGKANIEKILLKVSRERKVAMRDEIISMIPKVIYADPSARLGMIEDAFDQTVKGVLDRVETVRNQMKEGKIVNYEFDEEESWKYFAFGKRGPHEWDTYFSRKTWHHGP